MTKHVFEALEEGLADLPDSIYSNARAKWLVFTDRFKAGCLHLMFGIALPSQGFETMKLHSKVGGVR